MPARGAHLSDPRCKLIAVVGRLAVAVMPAFVVVCVLLVVAGAAKVRSPSSAQQSLSLIGVRAPALAVRVLGIVEIVLGGIAAVSPGRLSAGLVASAYAGFCVFALGLRRRGDDPDCGCFGGAGMGNALTHLSLNALACCAAALATLVPPPGVGWILTRSPAVAAPLALGTAAAALGAYCAFTLFPEAWRAYEGGVRR
jgi:hypothetical protein